MAAEKLNEHDNRWFGIIDACYAANSVQANGVGIIK